MDLAVAVGITVRDGRHPGKRRASVSAAAPHAMASRRVKRNESIDRVLLLHYKKLRLPSPGQTHIDLIIEVLVRLDERGKRVHAMALLPSRAVIAGAPCRRRGSLY